MTDYRRHANNRIRKAIELATPEDRVSIALEIATVGRKEIVDLVAKIIETWVEAEVILSSRYVPPGLYKKRDALFGRLADKSMGLYKTLTIRDTVNSIATRIYNKEKRNDPTNAK